MNYILLIRELSMKKIQYIALILIALTAVSSLYAEENEQTIEELYLQSQVKVKIIKAEADSIDRDMKIIALQDIEEMIGDGQVSPSDKQMLGILANLGSEGISNQVIEQGSVINNYPMVRKEACRLLGEVGGDYARDALVNVLISDNEPMVMSEAVVALSKVGPDEQGIVIAVLADSMRSQTALNKDNNFANAFILAIDNLAVNSEGIDDLRIFEELTKIADPRSGYITVVRKKAFELLKNLQNF
ncbi:MAG: hypothetical protein B6241_02520 [Spirochaetaceae bacterium 4572_59]|nr:MAG: hypothetical protein B6241_02520 [Spirochaetaceae bacterium 4572_59]